MTVAEAEALANGVALHRRKLTTIYITHGHFDHFAGLSVLLQRFPDVRAIATPKSVELMRKQSELMPFLRKRWPGQLPTKIVFPEPYDKDVFTLEGHELRIIEQGQTDAIDTTSLHVPSFDLVVSGDVIYNQCHMYVGDTTAESRANWIVALERLAVEPDDRHSGPQEDRRAGHPVDHRSVETIPRRFQPTQGGDMQRPRTLRCNDRTVSRPGQPPGVVDVRLWATKHQLDARWKESRFLISSVVRRGRQTRRPRKWEDCHDNEGREGLRV